MLGRGEVADTVSELSQIPRSSLHPILDKFVHRFSEAFYKDFVKFPTGESLVKVMSCYSKCGFPGAVGSMDCTHVTWNQCPVNLINNCTGRQKKPTLAFNCIVDHSRRILYCSNAPFFGAVNDITICHNDPLCIDLVRGKLRDVEFDVFYLWGLSTGGWWVSEVWLFCSTL